MSDRFFVIGSNSFSGATFIRTLLEAGHEVFGTSRSPEPARAFLPYRWLSEALQSHFQFQQLDLNSDTDRIAELVDTFRPTYVVNFAAQSMVAESWLHPEDWYRTNVIANVRLHETIRRCGFIKKYVHISTPEVYGSCSGNVTEEAPFNPSTPYAASRAACDMHLLTFFKHHGFPVCFTRAANVYGPGQQLYRILPRTIFFIKTGRRLQLHGGGKSVRSFIHARDVAVGTLLVAQQGETGQVYHFSTDLYISIREVVERVCAQMGEQFDRVVEVVGERPGKDAAYLLDSSRARTNLGWNAQVGLEQGIDETIRWVTDNLNELKEQTVDYVHKP
jgi:dTDP-glucose 4,6-dehydratase